MKSERAYPVAVITDKGARFTAGGHPWIYDAEVIEIHGSPENGSLVDAVTGGGRYIGTGFISLSSKIRIRLISRNANDRFDAAFWRRRVEYAYAYRRSVMPRDLDCFRLIFGEADHFPGLTADLFGDVLVTETLSLGTELQKPVIFPIIADLLSANGRPIRGIYERNESALRRLEGLDCGKGWFPGLPHSGDTTVEITENGIKYSVDFENGQKTGFFLDQKYNRRAVAAISDGKRVLDCFTHTGSFALNAASGGALSVTAVDCSETAIEAARRNAALNGLSDRVEFLTADVFDLLPEIPRGSYDLVILDPPAFTKSRRTADSAFRGYKEINLRAMKLLPRGGFLATCSCSHFMPDDEFCRMLKSAAADAAIELRQVEARLQAPDHPILWQVPETSYLKFYIFQIV